MQLCNLYTRGYVGSLLVVCECRKVEDLQFTAEEAAIDRSDLEVVTAAVNVVGWMLCSKLTVKKVNLYSALLFPVSKVLRYGRV